MSKPALEYVLSRLQFDVDAGVAAWIDATKHHRRLNGKEAGLPRQGMSGKSYWVIKIDGVAYKRSHLIFLAANGRWPDLQIDHINGDSLDDGISNLREVTATQNAWNHKKRARRIALPMGVRSIQASNRFQARIACNKKTHYLGSYETPEEAHKVYLEKRKELFGEYA